MSMEKGDRDERHSPPAFNIPPATLWSALFIIGVFLGLRFGPQGWTEWMLENLAFSTVAFDQALSIGRLRPADVAPLVAYSLIHLDLLHLLLNVGLLVAFGSLVERVHGKAWYLGIFAFTAAAGAVVQYLAVPQEESIMIGASGAVYGLIGAAVPLMFWSRDGYRWRKGLGFVAVIMLLNIVLGPLSSSLDLFGAVVAWQAHIGGFFSGLAIGALLILRRLGRI